MEALVSGNGRHPRPGALVVGGDFLGLGIARSLGEQGIPVCVIDDEPSIARYSRYVSRAVRVADLRDEEQTVSALLDVGRSLGLDGWVLFPTRDETVVACAKHRDVLAKQFRVSVPPWESTRWASDKRLTYRLAAQVGVPAPHATAPEEQSNRDGGFPLVIKPAFKSPFIYKTGVKAWHVDTPEELSQRTEDAAAHIP